MNVSRRREFCPQEVPKSFMNAFRRPSSSDVRQMCHKHMVTVYRVDGASRLRAELILSQQQQQQNAQTFTNKKKVLVLKHVLTKKKAKLLKKISRNIGM